MSSGKDELRSSLADLMVYGAFLVILLLSIHLGCIDLTLPFRSEQPESPEQTLSSESVIEAVQGRRMLCTAALDMEVLLSRGEQDRRFLLPDGYTEVSARIPGSVRAGVDLETLRDGNLTVSRVGPLIAVAVRLPPAEITTVSINYPGIRWNHASDLLQVFRADTRAILIRTELLNEARRILPARAVQAGLLIQAEQNAVEVITDTANNLGADRVEITFTEGGPRC